MVDWTSGAILNLASSVADLALAAYVLVLRPVRALDIHDEIEREPDSRQGGA